MDDLTPRQQRFVDEYLIDLNGTQAAIRAGYSAKTANEQAARLLANVSVADAVQAAKDNRSERTGVTADYVLNTIVSTIERCRQVEAVFDRKGDPVMVETPDGEMARAYTFNAMGVLKGAELLGKHLKLFTDKVEHAGTIEVDQKVREDADVVTSAVAGLAARIGTARMAEPTQH